LTKDQSDLFAENGIIYLLIVSFTIPVPNSCVIVVVFCFTKVMDSKLPAKKKI
jgi:hypothetical protein